MRLVKNPSYKHTKEILENFNKLKAYIYYKDHTQYNDISIEKIMLIAGVSKEKFKLKANTTSWLTKILIDENREKHREYEKYNQGKSRDFDFGVFEHCDFSDKEYFQAFTEDYWLVLQAYEKNKKHIPNIFIYNNIQQLSNALEELGTDNLIVSDKTLDIFFELDGWFIAMPHTTEASCFLGKQTSWCTARTKTENMFRSYVGQPDRDTILFYLIRIDGNPLINPNDKISIGFNNCVPKFNSDMTVNAANVKLTKLDLIAILGEEKTDQILDEMTAKCKKTEKHPLRIKMEKLIKDRKLFRMELESINNEKEKESLLKQAVQYKEPDNGVVVEIILNAPNGSSLEYSQKIVTDTNFRESEIKELIDKNQTANILFISTFFKHTKITRKMMIYALDRDFSNKIEEENIENLVYNNLMDEEIFNMIFNYFGESTIGPLSSNPTLTMYMAIKIAEFVFNEESKKYNKPNVINNLLKTQKDNHDSIIKLIPYIFKIDSHANRLMPINEIITILSKKINIYEVTRSIKVQNSIEEILYTLLESATFDITVQKIISVVINENISSPAKLLEIIDKFDKKKTGKGELYYIKEYLKNKRK